MKTTPLCTIAKKAIAKHPDKERQIKAALDLAQDVATRPQPVEPPALRFWYASDEAHTWQDRQTYLVDTVGQTCSCPTNRAHRRNPYTRRDPWCTHRLAVAMIILSAGDHYPKPVPLTAEDEQAQQTANQARAAAILGMADATAA